jgi:hypothetical protein
MANLVSFVAKHAFQGDPAQSQLSFPQEAMLTAKADQVGNSWWWGSYNGREGWFPPAYVSPTGAPPQRPAMTQSMPPTNMQQRMQQVTFTSSVQQQQQQRQMFSNSLPPQQVFGAPQQQQGVPQQGFGAPQQQQGFPQQGFGVPQQQQGVPQQGFGAQLQGYPPHQQGFGSPPPKQQPQGFSGFGVPPPIQGGGMRNMTEDPFAGLNPVPSPMMKTSALQKPEESSKPSEVSSSPAPSFSSSPSKDLSVGTSKQMLSSSPSKDASISAAYVRMGLSPSNSGASTPVKSVSGVSTPVTTLSRDPSPVPPAKTATAAKPVAAKPAVKASTMKTADHPPRPSPPRQSKEEQEARQLREKEEARIRAQMLKEKAELENQQVPTVPSEGGLGSSGVAIIDADTGEVEVGSTRSTSGVSELSGSSQTGEPLFNPYNFLAGHEGGFPNRKFSPIFRVPPFWSLMRLDSYIRRFPLPKDRSKDTTGMYEQLAKALSFICHVVVETDSACRSGRGRFGLKRSNTTRVSPLAFLRQNHLGCEACIKLISILPHSAGTSGKTLDGLFLNFINVFLSLMENLQPNQQLVLPGGWQQPDYTHVCLYIVRNCGDNRFSFSVCNTGTDGLEYHPSSFDPETGRKLKQMAMTIWDIPVSRLTDSTFWTVLFRMQVYPSKKNCAAFLYTKLLPSLNARPLLSNLDLGPSDFLEPPDEIAAATFHPLAALVLTTTPSAGARPSKYASLLVMNAAVDLAYAEIENAPPSSMDPEDTRILKLSGRNLANFASTLDPNTVGDGSLGPSLSNTWDLLDKLLKKLNFASSKPMDQHSHGLPASAFNDEFSKGTIPALRTDAGSAAYPLFGRLRTDNYENTVKELMGNPRPDPILIPAVLTDETLPPVATTYDNAASSLQRIADACSLLMQQRKMIKNAAAFAASASQYALTSVLPMPHLDPGYCFWRKADMRRETQLNLLFLIRRMCRIYSAATACVQQSRGLVAIRSTALASAACVADAICRVKAVDDPSTFALHYSGLCEGPTQPFGIQAGAFDTLASNLPIYDPNICALRFQCLDYLHGRCVKADGAHQNTIFNFDISMTPMEGDVELIEQLSIQLALPRPYPATDEAKMNHSASLISGKNGSIMEVLPEFEYYRDIIFHFKHSVSGKSAFSEGTSDKVTWLPSDATLHWDMARIKEKEERNGETEKIIIYEYRVTAFGNHPQEYVDRIAAEQKSTTAFQGFLSLFGKSTTERARLSSADPTNVVNSCGEKFQNSR